MHTSAGPVNLSICFAHPIYRPFAWFSSEFYVQQDGTLRHYHQDLRADLDDVLPGRLIGRRNAVEFPPHSPDLIFFDFYQWGTLKDVVFCRKTLMLAALREEIEVSCRVVHVDALVSVVHHNQRCLDANGNHFEHLM